MLAWAHFVLSECAPLYAVQLAFTSYVISKELESNWGGSHFEDCWMNSAYARCATSCAPLHIWHGRRCSCERDAFKRCERLESLRNVSSPAHDPDEAYVPRFVWADGLTMQHRLEPSDADFFVPGRVDAYRHEARHRSNAYPPFNTDYVPHESLFFNYFAFACTSFMFVFANVIFLRRVGPRAKLDGAYVRFCLSLERERTYRTLVIAYSVFLVGFMLAGVAFLFFQNGIVPQLSDAMELVLIVMACRAMMLPEGAPAAEHPAFAEMRFRFGPLLWQGCDEVVNDLIAARERRRSRPEVYAAKLKKYVESGGEKFVECVAVEDRGGA